jgi:hypothetical protein
VSYVVVLFPERREVFIDGDNQGDNTGANGRPRALLVGVASPTFRLGGGSGVIPLSQTIEVPEASISAPFVVVFTKMA